MSRNAVIAALLSLLLHAGVAFSGYLIPEPEVPAAAEEEIPTIALDMPPPPEPEEPETVENIVAEDTAPSDVADLAAPMLADLPSAIIDSPFVQQLQAPPPPGLTRPSGNIVIPTGPPRPVAGGGLKNLFNLAELDKKPTPTFQPRPVYPFELKRLGVEGEVLVRFVVDSQGNVRDPEIIRSTNPGFDDAVITAVLKWRFRPGQKGGAAVNTRNVQIPIPFSLKSE
jgi:protein TonB